MPPHSTDDTVLFVRLLSFQIIKTLTFSHRFIDLTQNRTGS